MKIRDKAWLAGFFDGEGCVCITRSSRTKCYRLIMSITQKDKPVLKKVQKMWGGSLRKTTKRNMDIYWTLDWCLKREAKTVLQDILPHAKLKHKQIQIALRFIDKMPGQGSGRQPKQWMENARNRMKALKR